VALATHTPFGSLSVFLKESLYTVRVASLSFEKSQIFVSDLFPIVKPVPEPLASLRNLQAESDKALCSEFWCLSDSTEDWLIGDIFSRYAGGQYVVPKGSKLLQNIYLRS
jgi:hypothetical protein